MLTALWSSVGSKVGERWATLIASPALAFWFGGLLAWAYAHGGLVGAHASWRRLADDYQTNIGDAGTVAQLAALAVLAIGVAVSAAIAEQLSLPTLRLLEGYWPKPFVGVRSWRIRRRDRRISRQADRWRALALRSAELSDSERAEYRHLSTRRARVPVDPAQRMPTAFGDLLRAIESRPDNWYGLDAVTCFPRLWMVLPDSARADLALTRTRLDRLAVLWIWSVLFTVWVVFAWWALLVALAGALTAYVMLLGAAVAYGEQLQACYDLYRGALYTALGATQPADAEAERRAGRELSRRLQRGPGR